MLSDDSSSDSETGRFKSQSKPEDNCNKREDSFRSSGRSKQSDNRFRRDLDRSRDDRDSDKYSRDKSRYSRYSPSRRRRSRNRGSRRSRDRNRRRNSNDRSRTHDRRRSISRDRRDRSRSKSHKGRDERARSQKSADRPRPNVPSDIKRDLKEEIKKTIEPKITTKHSRRSNDRDSTSPEVGKKQSAVLKPPPSKKRADSSEVVEHESDNAAEVQPGSYYSMIPAIVKGKSEESSEIDSSDDERLRAKLLNLEKELQKTKKKKEKHRKKHKKKSSKSGKDRDESNTSVEVTSTTDDVIEISDNKAETIPEVSSTQRVQKESSEEGEISSDDGTQGSQEVDYDPSDLRHKLRSRAKTTPKPDVCGPALPPHLENSHRRSASAEIEGPMLPPHLQSKKDIGPSIPSDMRKILAERDCEVIEHSSDEDGGIGPLPAGSEGKWSEAHQRLEERALDIKIKKLDGRSVESQKIKSREQWMLELPEGKAKYLGLEARTFRAKEGPDMSDRSSWTDTPEEKARKAAGLATEEDPDEVMRREARAKQISSRDEEQESAVRKHKKKHKREESLLEMHQKKLKKKKKKEEKDESKKERRPFSRDVDLQVNRFDEAQKQSIIKKAQGLNSRFSQGEAKFL